MAVNGRVVTELGIRADPERDRITVEGRPLSRAPGLLYLAFHKPTGVLTTLSDPAGRPTLKEAIGPQPARLFPVGRLDYNSSGLVILTNDGDLAYKLMHPRYGIEKVYRVKVRGVPSPETIRRMRQGVDLDDGPCKPLRVRIEERRKTKSWLEIVVREGRHHLVRRLCAAVGHPVEKLVRIGIGPVRLGGLKLGMWRPLRAQEVALLRRAARSGRDLRERSGA